MLTDAAAFGVYVRFSSQTILFCCYTIAYSFVHFLCVTCKQRMMMMKVFYSALESQGRTTDMVGGVGF
jgi:hypothetical protein